MNISNKSILFFIMIFLFFISGCTDIDIGKEKQTNSQNNNEELCINENGTWIDGANECEGISKQACEKIGGTFNPCASACRNDPDAEFCTMQCVMVCQFSDQ